MATAVIDSPIRKRRLRIGVDTGGTFTDIVLVDGITSRMSTLKIPSTNDDPSRAILAGVREVLTAASCEIGELEFVGHGTTVATNAAIQRTFGRTALVATGGFRDVLELARQRRPDLYDIDVAKPEPVTPRHLRFELHERLDKSGTVVIAVDPEELAHLGASLAEAAVDAVAIVLLHSYANPQHERDVAAHLRSVLPQAFVSPSSDIDAEFREFERTSTTVLNAALLPVMDTYLANLQHELHAPLQIIQSNGGLMGPSAARERPINTLLSGPAAGVYGAVAFADAAAHHDIITFDMGGTSTDVSLVSGSAPQLRHELTVGGFPIRVTALDINTVGAGGGSIAWIDAGGFLHAGPQSAGAQPGPACYMRGGTAPTVADANVALGRLNPIALLDGRMPIDRNLALTALETVAWPAGAANGTRDPLAIAAAVLQIVNANMAQAIRTVSVERGIDPRNFTLVAFGGAGPLHAVEVARELGMPRVLVPPSPGLVCAIGLLYADLRADFSQTLLLSIQPGCEMAIDKAFTSLERRAGDWASRERAPDVSIVRELAMRYRGQTHELLVRVDAGAVIFSDLIERFHARHHEVYNFAADTEAVEVTTLRVTVRGTSPKPPLPGVERGTNDLARAWSGEREVFWPDGARSTPVYRRERLLGGDTIPGPAIVEQMDTTTVLPPGCSASVDGIGNLLVTLETA